MTFSNIIHTKSQTKPNINVFPFRITEPWNNLPDKVVTGTSLESFKTRLDKFWYNQDINQSINQSIKFYFVTTRIHIH